MSGVIFDLTGSYHAAFVNGLIWNLVNVSIALWLLTRPAGGPRTDEAQLLFAPHRGGGERWSRAGTAPRGVLLFIRAVNSSCVSFITAACNPRAIDWRF